MLIRKTNVLIVGKTDIVYGTQQYVNKEDRSMLRFGGGKPIF